MIGYAVRPAAMLVGQLPFGTVITAGASLQGFDQVLLPVAQQSFIYLFAGIAIGAVAGVFLYAAMRNR
jgi:hypothetical protein